MTDKHEHEVDDFMGKSESDRGLLWMAIESLGVKFICAVCAALLAWLIFLTFSHYEDKERMTAHESADQTRNLMTQQSGSDLKAELLAAINSSGDKYLVRINGQGEELAALKTGLNDVKERMNAQAQIAMRNNELLTDATAKLSVALDDAKKDRAANERRDIEIENLKRKRQ